MAADGTGKYGCHLALVGQEAAGAPEKVASPDIAFTQDDLLPLSLKRKNWPPLTWSKSGSSQIRRRCAPLASPSSTHPGHRELETSSTWSTSSARPDLTVSICCRLSLVRILSSLNSFMTMPKKKTFDAVPNRASGARRRRVVATMTRTERIAFLNQRIADFPKTRPKVQRRKPSPLPKPKSQPRLSLIRWS